MKIGDIAGILVCLVAAAAGPALADDDRGATVAATASAASLESTTAFSFAGAAGYQFTRMAAIEIEATTIPELKSSLPGGSTFVTSASTVGSSFIEFLTTPTFRSTSGRAVIFTTNMRIQLPTTTRRLTPFFVAGGGVANLRHSADLIFPVPLLPVPIPVSRPTSQRVTSTATDLALTIGGGLDVSLATRLSVTADLRYFRLFGEQDLNVGRFGAGVRYRF